VTEFLAGAAFLGCCGIAFYFLRQWSRDRDRLFLAFGLAFATLAAHYVLLPFYVPDADEAPAVFAMRLIAFGLIIGGIIEKNRPSRGD
jgi:Family of unknown function (DUF5985)